MPVARALLVGAESYAHYHETPYCHADVDLLVKTLLECCSVIPTDIKVLKLAPSDGITPATLVDEVKALAQVLHPGDTFLFFFAGHGRYLRSQEMTYLLLPDSDPDDIPSTALRLRDISDNMRVPRCINLRIFDACHSGTFARDAEVDDGPQLTRGLLTEESGGWITLASCQAGQFSWPDETTGHGVFTHALARAIREQPPGSVAPEMLKLRVCALVADWASRTGKRQTPAFHLELAGNVSLFDRKQPPRPKADQGKDLAQRMAHATRHRQIENNDRTLLEQIIAEMGAVLTSASAELDWLGERVDIGPVSSAMYAPEEIKKVILTKADGARLRPRHDLRIETTVVDPRKQSYLVPGMAAIAAMTFSQPYTETDYIIREEGWPDSYVALHVAGGQFTPAAVLFVYLLPLQISARLVIGGIVKDRRSNDWRRTGVDQRPFDLADYATAGLPAAVVAELKKLHQAFTRATSEELAALEWEAEQAGIAVVTPDESPAKPADESS